jgi:hypothetical protein
LAIKILPIEIAAIHIPAIEIPAIRIISIEIEAIAPQLVPFSIFPLTAIEIAAIQVGAIELAPGAIHTPGLPIFWSELGLVFIQVTALAQGLAFAPLLHLHVLQLLLWHHGPTGGGLDAALFAGGGLAGG